MSQPSDAPPAYEPQEPANLRPHLPDEIIIQPGAPIVCATEPKVVIVHPIKKASSYKPYTEFCPYCNVNVVTNPVYVSGKMSCFILILCVLFFIILMLILPFVMCVFGHVLRDAHHYCPRCCRLLSMKKRC